MNQAFKFTLLIVLGAHIPLWAETLATDDDTGGVEELLSDSEASRAIAIQREQEQVRLQARKVKVEAQRDATVEKAKAARKVSDKKIAESEARIADYKLAINMMHADIKKQEDEMAANQKQVDSLQYKVDTMAGETRALEAQNNANIKKNEDLQKQQLALSKKAKNKRKKLAVIQLKFAQSAAALKHTQASSKSAPVVKNAAAEE